MDFNEIVEKTIPGVNGDTAYAAAFRKTFIPVSAAYAQRPRTWHRKSSRRSSGDGHDDRHDDRLAMRRRRAGAKVRIWKNTKLS